MTGTGNPAQGSAAPRKRVLLAKPRGYCAGVDRAVQTVEEALKLYGPPIYVRKEIVHNKHVVTRLREQGVIFVEENEEVPEGATAQTAWEALAAETPGLSERRRGLAASINRRYAPFDSPLAEGDEVVFIPPVSGG